MTARDELAAVLAEHDDPDGWTCDDDGRPVYLCCCGDQPPPLATDFITPADAHAATAWHRQHLADALLASPALARVIQEAKAEALREAAEWVAEHVGYPVETLTPDHPAPPEFWDALVDHIHADTTGHWHGNELSRDEVASWLDDEAGRDPEETFKSHT